MLLSCFLGVLKKPAGNTKFDENPSSRLVRLLVLCSFRETYLADYCSILLSRLIKEKKQPQPQHLTAPAPSGEMLQSKKNVFLSLSNCKNHRLLSGLSHISCMQLCREAYSLKSMCVCALNRHTSSLSLAACVCVCMRCSVTSVCTCLVVTGQQT